MTSFIRRYLFFSESFKATPPCASGPCGYMLLANCKFTAFHHVSQYHFSHKNYLLCRIDCMLLHVHVVGRKMDI